MGDIVIGEDNDPLINAEIHYNYGKEDPWILMGHSAFRNQVLGCLAKNVLYMDRILQLHLVMLKRKLRKLFVQ